MKSFCVTMTKFTMKTEVRENYVSQQSFNLLKEFLAGS